MGLREQLQVARFVTQWVKEGKDPKEGLAWALREIYFVRLHNGEDRDLVRKDIEAIEIFKGVDLESIFGESGMELWDYEKLYGPLLGKIKYLSRDPEGKLNDKAKRALKDFERELARGPVEAVDMKGDLRVTQALVGNSINILTYNT